jgi:hypothetical protein
MRNLDDGTDDGTDGWKGRRPPDRLRILYKKDIEPYLLPHMGCWLAGVLKKNQNQNQRVGPIPRALQNFRQIVRHIFGRQGHTNKSPILRAPSTGWMPGIPQLWMNLG